MSGSTFEFVAYALLSCLGLVSLAYLGFTLRDWRVARGVNALVEPMAGDRQEPVATQAPPVETPRKDEDDEKEGQPAIPDRPKGSLKRHRLQQLLTEAVGLDRRLPALPSFNLSLQPTTRPEDVDAWEASVEAELHDRPRDLALFHYEPQQSPLAAFSLVTALHDPLKRRLEQRMRQLETIVRRTP